MGYQDVPMHTIYGILCNKNTMKELFKEEIYKLFNEDEEKEYDNDELFNDNDLFDEYVMETDLLWCLKDNLQKSDYSITMMEIPHDVKEKYNKKEVEKNKEVEKVDFIIGISIDTVKSSMYRTLMDFLFLEYE